MSQISNSFQPNFNSMEGYVLGRMVVSLLENSAGLTVNDFLDTIYRQNYILIDELVIGPFGSNCNQGLHQVWLVQLFSNYSSSISKISSPSCGFTPNKFFNCQLKVYVIDRFSRWNETTNLIHSEKTCDGYFDCPNFDDETISICRQGNSSNFLRNSIYPAWMLWTLIALLGILLTTAIIIFIIKYKKRKELRALSPPFMISMLVGVILIYVCVIIFPLPASPFMCSFQIWLPCISFIVIIGSLIVKAWKIHKLFSDSNLAMLNNKHIKNHTLAKMLSIFIAIQVGLLVIWTAADTVLPQPVPLTPTSNRIACSSKNFFTYATITLLYHVVVLIYGGYLAFKTRKADSRYNSKTIAVAIYQFIISYMVILLSNLLLSDLVFRYIVSSLLLCLTNLIVMLVLFSRKIFHIIRHPEVPDRVVKELEVQKGGL